MIWIRWRFLFLVSGFESIGTYKLSYGTRTEFEPELGKYILLTRMDMVSLKVFGTARLITHFSSYPSQSITVSCNWYFSNAQWTCLQMDRKRNLGVTRVKPIRYQNSNTKRCKTMSRELSLSLSLFPFAWI